MSSRTRHEPTQSSTTTRFDCWWTASPSADGHCAVAATFMLGDYYFSSPLTIQCLLGPRAFNDRFWNVTSLFKATPVIKMLQHNIAF